METHRFHIHLDTDTPMVSRGEILEKVEEILGNAGASDVSVKYDPERGRPRAAFTIEAGSIQEAGQIANGLIERIIAGMPSGSGEWKVVKVADD